MPRIINLLLCVSISAVSFSVLCAIIGFKLISFNLFNFFIMETSILIAKLIAAVYLFAGLGMLVNMGYYQKAIKAWIEDSSFKVLGGMLAVVAGVLLITFHNVWAGEWWVVLITIMGWLSLIKGFLYLVIPESLSIFLPLYNKQYMPIWAVLMIVIGGAFGYFGFLA